MRILAWLMALASAQVSLGGPTQFLELSRKEKNALLKAWKSFENDTKAGEGVFLAYLEGDPDKQTIMSLISKATSIPEDQLVSQGVIEMIGKRTLGPYQEIMGALDDSKQLDKIAQKLRSLYSKDGINPKDLDRKNMMVINVMKNKLGSKLTPEVETNLSKLLNTVRNRIYFENK